MGKAAKGLGLALIPVIALGAGGYSYYQYQAKQALERVVEQLSPWMQISYGSVSADLDGVVTLNQVALLPAQDNGGISAERLTIATGGAGYLMAAASDGLSRWPDQVSLKFNQLDFALTPSNIIMADNWSAILIPQTEISKALTMACGGHQPLSMRQLYEMGIESLSGNGELRFALNSADDRIETVINLQLRELLNLELESTFKTEMPMLSEAMLEGYPIWFSGAQLQYADTGYHSRRNSYCAGLDDDIVAQYLKLHKQRVMDMARQTGWQVGQREIFDYQLLISDRGSFKLQWQPAEPVALNKRNEIGWRTLQPNIQLGQRQLELTDVIPELSAIARIEAQTEMQAPGAGNPQLSEEEQRREQTREAIRRAVKGSAQEGSVTREYRDVDPERIEHFIGSRIKLQTYYGRKVEGTLKRVNGNMLYVDEHMGQGSAMYPIDKTKLSSLQVFH